MRDTVREMLTSGKIGTTKWGPWLNWELEAAQALGIPWCVRWFLAFEHRQISVGLEVPSRCRKKGAVKDLLAFVGETPIDRRRRDRYPMRRGEYGYFDIYSHRLVGDEILSGTSTEAVTESVLQAVADFLDAEDSDYTRINDYFRCLAFRPKPTTATEPTTAVVPEEAK